MTTTGTDGMGRKVARFQAARDGRGFWRVKDTYKGTLASARMKDRARCEAQAATMSAKLDAIGEATR